MSTLFFFYSYSYSNVKFAIYSKCRLVEVTSLTIIAIFSIDKINPLCLERKKFKKKLAEPKICSSEKIKKIGFEQLNVDTV